MFEELLPGIYRMAHRWVEGNNGIVIGSRRAVAVDTGAFEDEGRAMAAFIRERGYEPRWLVLTHGHVDHVRGGAAFAEAEIFAHVKTPDVIGRQLPDWAARDRLSVEQTAVRTIWPTVTFVKELQLALGDRTLYLFPAPGHSEDGICVYLPAERLLFAGDTVSTGIAPALNDGDSHTLERSVDRLLRLDVEILVPGHGPVLHGRAAVQEWLAWLIGYLSGLRALVRDGLDRGDEPAAILQAAAYDRFIGDRLPADQHGMPHRHRMAVEKIIEEERAR